MTNKAKIIAIAEACGRKHCPNCPDQGWYGVETGGCDMDGENDTRDYHQQQCEWCDTVENSIYKSPDYLSDLNACHEFEKGMDDGQYDTFEQELALIVGFKYHDESPAPSGLRLVVSATAAQRCEAYLKTIGKWEETK